MGIGLLRRHYGGQSAAAEPEGAPSEDWTVAQLREHAQANSVDLAGATKKAEILAAIQAAQQGA